MEPNNTNEIILYQPDDELKLDVRVEDETAGVAVAIYDGMISKQLRLDVEKHNAQYPKGGVRGVRRRCGEMRP